MMTLLFVVVLGLAFANGANDNFKGVATLHGSGRLDYRRALAWATVTTLAGSIMAVVLGSHLVATFSGKGIVPASLVGDPSFVLAVGVGASGTVLLATRFGYPISTTHALIGGMAGGGLMLGGSKTDLGQLGAVAALPLLMSPLVAAILAFSFYRVMRLVRRAVGIRKESCVCIGAPASVAGVPETRVPDGYLQIESGGIASGVLERSPPIVAHARGCRARHDGVLVGVDAQQALDAMHFLSTGAVGFARGLNDTPKIVALLTAGAILGVEHAVLWVAGLMALGGVLGARRVARTMSHEITSMNDGQGFSANFVTALLVLFASRFGMPVSTTHVSVGALFGIGAATGGGHRKAIVSILLAWVATLPVAAGIAAAVAAGVSAAS